LLTMTEPAGAGVPTPRAFLRVGGVTLARHQLGLALAMGCQRIICVAREVTPDLIALQHEAERAGAHFHIISGPRALAGLITANDDLLGLTEGLLAESKEAAALLEPGHTVLVQPVEVGVAAGYERIDLNHAMAGAFRIPGRLVERLLELPADYDVPSALTRIALQAGVAMQEVPASARDGARWRLIRDEAQAQAVEDDWLRLHMGERGAPTPVTLLSRFGLWTLGSSLLHAGNGSRVALAAAFAAVLMGFGAGWLDFAVVGFVLLALAAVLRESAAILRRIERTSLSLPPSSLAPEDLLGGLIDLAVVALVVWRTPAMPWDALAERVFAPVMLVILVRLAPRLADRVVAPWIEDRVVLALLLAVAAGTGFLPEGVQLLALLLALAGLLFPGGKPRLT
jgi:hypothetical protein